MRVTRESLIRIAKETAQERAFNDRDIIAAYLTGSLVSSEIDPILGGTAEDGNASLVPDPASCESNSAV